MKPRVALLDVNVLVALVDPSHVHHATAHDQTLRAGLQKFCAAPGHRFWPDAVSLHDDALFDRSVVLTHRQLTDIYLLGLAVRMDGTLATFDSHIAIRAVRGAKPAHLTVIAPVD